MIRSKHNIHIIYTCHNFNMLIIISQLPYTWKVESNNGIAMKKPELDIPESGWVPSHVQMFRLKLPCTGVVSAEVRVQLTINITAINPKHSDVSLVFRRNKICLKTTDMLLDSLIGKCTLLYNCSRNTRFKTLCCWIYCSILSSVS